MNGTRRIMGGLALAGLMVLGGAAPVAAQGAEEILETRCASCHARQPDGSLSRVGQARKTPEGWVMTLFRMNHVHNAGTTPEETQVLAKWLADRQGLAPEEAAPYRYILERQPAVVEGPVTEGDLSTMCARCHSFARVGLQRRNADDWLKLVHFHLGQWPTTEYQALGRDRKWWEIASTQLPEVLARMFPLQTDAWAAWRDAPKPDLSGTWIVTGHRPGTGNYGGIATIGKEGAKDGDGYAVTYDLLDSAGESLPGTGKSIVYTGYEWRGATTLGGESIREVLAASSDGKRLEGRWFLENRDEIGASFQAVKAEPGTPMIAGISREHLKQGETARFTVWGSGLDGAVDLGPGVSATVVSKSPTALVIEARADAAAAPGPRQVTVGAAKADGPVVYAQLDSLRVEPDYAIARVGGNGGRLPSVTAQFEAVGYLNGPDGSPGTDDDVRIGVVPASWTMEPYNEAAEEMEDVKFVGTIDRTGLFLPAGAGPNPDRVFSTNNVGDLKIVATSEDGGARLQGEGRLISTVQRWNDPPIR